MIGKKFISRISDLSIEEKVSMGKMCVLNIRKDPSIEDFLRKEKYEFESLVLYLVLYFINADGKFSIGEWLILNMILGININYDKANKSFFELEKNSVLLRSVITGSLNENSRKNLLVLGIIICSSDFEFTQSEEDAIEKIAEALGITTIE